MRLSLPVSIVLGSCAVAVSLYFALRPAEHTPSGHAPPAKPDTPQGLSERTTDQISADVQRAVEQAHPSWKAACWDAADAGTRRPGRYIAALAFDAGGSLAVSGISEIRELSDPNVAQCLRGVVHRVSIPAPGRPVSYEVPFALP